MNRYLFLFLIIISTLPLKGQKQANIWYFGQYAGLDFNTIDDQGRPTVLINGALATDEGCSTISDEDGNLLFYTNGETVWNRLHQVMPNGTGLYGSYTSTQSALIVPQPESDRYYYIFTTAAQGQDDGLNYSIVDMYSDDGFGDVATKNNQLYTPTTEKLTAVHHVNGRDIWVITHKWESDEFYVYLVTEKGLNETPVISRAGSVHEFGASNANTLGQMKVSAKGNLLALGIFDEQKVELFNFNKYLGRLYFKNSIVFKKDDNVNINIYGVEISINEIYVYVSESGPELFSGQKIYQYNLNEKTLNTLDSVHIGGSLQLGTDGKIYAVNVDNKEILVIERPNLPKSHPDFKISRMSIFPGKNWFGFPNFIQSYFYHPDPVVELPNVFTPNGDKYNEFFEPKSFQGVETFIMDVYSRLGRKVYSTSQPDEWWNGEGYPTGIYYWALQYEGVNGKKGFQKGWVHLFR